MTKEFNFLELKVADRLPSPSGIALEIMRLMQREDVTVHELARLVQTDPALTGRILRVANSPLIGVRRPVATVTDAVILIGLQAVKRFALGFSLVNGYQRGQCEAFDYPGYWADSLTFAVAIQAVTIRERTVAPEEAFTVGLLAEIGRLALATIWPAEYSTCLRSAQDETLKALERKLFAIDHDELSQMLLADWGFPVIFRDALKFRLEDEIQGNGRTERFGWQLAFARHIARYCRAHETQRTEYWPSLLAMATRHALDEEGLHGLLESVEQESNAWGSLLGIETVPPPPLPSSPDANAPQSPAPSTEGLNVLLVDDDPMIIARLSKQLTAAGHHVAACREGQQALQYVAQHPPHMVITDLRMKPMDGLQFCKAVRASGVGKNLYIIMLTSTEDENVLVEAFDTGIDDYVVKPPNLRVLNARIRAGARIVKLQEVLERDRLEIERYSSELAIANRRLEQMAHTDILTGLPNRRYALQRLEQEWSTVQRFKRPLSVMMLDLDHFKPINDTLGHDAGDRVLAHAAKVLREALRTSDIACRMGGEEFLVIAPNTDGAAALHLAERIRSSIEQHQIEGLTLPRPLTVSIGVAGTTGRQSGWQDLINLADKALYRVKHGTRNGVWLAS